MYGGLTIAIIVASLAVAAWCFVSAGRGSFISVWHLAGLGLVELVLLVQVVAAAVRMVGGERPVEFATFVGYLATAVLTVPAGISIAFMEKTRYGSVVAGAAALILAVLALRLLQVWTPLR